MDFEKCSDQCLKFYQAQTGNLCMFLEFAIRTGKANQAMQELYEVVKKMYQDIEKVFFTRNPEQEKKAFDQLINMALITFNKPLLAVYDPTQRGLHITCDYDYPRKGVKTISIAEKNSEVEYFVEDMNQIDEIYAKFDDIMDEFNKE